MRNMWIQRTLIVGLLVLGCLVPGSSAQGTLEESSRTEAELLPGLTAELATALREVLALQAEVVVLSRPPEGLDAAERRAFEKKVLAPDGDFIAFIEPRVLRIDFHEKQVPSMAVLLECLAHTEGWRAAGRLLQAAPELAPDELLGLYREEFLLGPPLWSSPLAVELAQHASEGLFPLSNGGALGYLTWGLLYRDEFWEAEGHDRESFVLALLERGFESASASEVVARALEFPMVEPRAALARTKPHRTTAASLESVRGKVGFTKAHEAFLTGDLEVLKAIEELPERGPDLGTGEARLAPDGQGGLGAEAEKLGHLKEWLPMMLMRVRAELYGADAGETMKRGRTLEEREFYWHERFRQLGFVGAREEALREIERVLAGQDQHALTARIEELELLREQGGLSEAEAEELERLSKKRQRERDSLVYTLIQEMAQRGQGEDYALALETLAVDLPGIIGDEYARRRDPIYHGWQSLSLMGGEKNLPTLESYFAGELKLGSSAIELLLYGLGNDHYPGGEAVARIAAEDGDAAQVRALLRTADWLSPETFRQGVDTLLEAFDHPRSVIPGGRDDRWSASAGLLEGMLKRDDARATLQLTIDQGRWMDPQAAGFLGAYKSDGYRELFKKEFTPGELKALQAAGQLAPGWL